MRAARTFAALNIFVLILAAACSPAAASTSLHTSETSTPSAAPPSASPIESGAIQLTPEPEPSASPTDTAPTLPPTSPPPTPCPPDLCIYEGLLALRRPILAPGNDTVDVTYRFGSTQGGLRDPHHGVEFLNGFGTPVVAAGDGVVVVAGDDRDPTSPHGTWPITFYGPYSYFYGNLVVIEHELSAMAGEGVPDIPRPLYTLYAHLSEVSVAVGDTVQAGQEIGKVGLSGVAEGSHLHFEVRLGENSYANSRNPELWLAPHADENGQPLGALAGRFIDSYGENLEKSDIVLQHLPEGPEGPSDLQITLMSYEEPALIGQPPWGESFAIGDIPAGWYRITFPHFGLQEQLVQVFSGQLTVVTFRVE